MAANGETRPDRRLKAMRRLAAHLAEKLDADIALRLWDGEVIPLGASGRRDLMVAINGPRAVGRLVRKPGLATVMELVAAGDVEIVGGTLLDVVDRVGEDRARGLGRRLDKGLLARTLLPFALGGGAKGAGHAYAGAQTRKAEAGRDDKALVQFHYDLSNAFYGLFLDPEMQYSCAYYPTWDTGLDAAQQAKLEMICRKLRLQAGERMLDIGCGWGGLVCHAAQHYGVRAHGVTLSQAQHDFAVEKVRRLGLEGLVTIELRDYRTLTEVYDKIASIGMYEHVGLDNRDAYFSQIKRLLKPRGVYLHHAITRSMKRSEKAFRKKRPEYAAVVDYIFPGSELDHVGGTAQALERHGFEVHDVEAWREHYARTTRLWCERLYANREAAEAEVGAAKTRLWLLYLAGVSLAFQRGTIGIFQTVTTRRERGGAGLPPSRGDLYA